MIIADGLKPSNGVYTDVVYGATTFAILANVIGIIALLWILWQFRHKIAQLGHWPVIGLFVWAVAVITIYGEEALHAHVGYGASWQVTEHGIFFLLGRTFGLVVLALTAPWDGSRRIRLPRRRRKTPKRSPPPSYPTHGQPKVDWVSVLRWVPLGILVLIVGVVLGGVIA